MGFIAGIITGIIIATVGVNGIATVMDNGVQIVKRFANENIK
jgi:hypothetical protein